MEYRPSAEALTADEQLLSRLREKANQLPFSPGVYIMHDRTGKVIIDHAGLSFLWDHRMSSLFTC